MKSTEAVVLGNAIINRAYSGKFPFSPDKFPYRKPDGKPLSRENRTWVHIHFLGFRQDPDSIDFSGHVIGVRSDGEFFNVRITLSAEDEVADPEALIHEMNDKVSRAYEKLNSYRDCSCGIMGHKRIINPDPDHDPKDGYIVVPVFSPCEDHPG